MRLKKECDSGIKLSYSFTKNKDVAMIYKKICENNFTASFDENQEIILELASISYDKIPIEDYQNIDDFLSTLLSMDNTQNINAIEDKSLIPKLNDLLTHLRNNTI